MDQEWNDGVVLGHEPHDSVQAQMHALDHYALAPRLALMQDLGTGSEAVYGSQSLYAVMESPAQQLNHEVPGTNPQYCRHLQCKMFCRH